LFVNVESGRLKDVLAGERGILGFPGGAGLFGLDLGSLAVPVFEVLVHGGLLGGLVFAQHGGDPPGGSGGVAVHGVVELGIAGVVFLLEGGGRHCGIRTGQVKSL
jgi:hypothetical protein